MTWAAIFDFSVRRWVKVPVDALEIGNVTVRFFDDRPIDTSTNLVTATPDVGRDGRLECVNCRIDGLSVPAASEVEE